MTNNYSFFAFLVLSVRRKEKIQEELNTEQLYQKARDSQIPTHEWYQWIPQQIQLLLRQTDLQKVHHELNAKLFDSNQKHS